MDSFGISGGPGGIGLDYNWSQRDGDTVSSQSNHFFNMFMGNSTNDFGVAVGWGQAMCSETTWQNCYFSGKTGMRIGNYNALSHTIIGGNCSGCADYGIHVASGAAPCIQSMGFQNYEGSAGAGTPAAKADIYIENGAGDGYAIISCRSESPHFFQCGPSMAYNLIGCAHMGDGKFFSGTAPINLIGCFSKGYVDGYLSGREANVIGCVFTLPDWERWHLS